MEKRRNMKKDGIGIQNVEYIETCKTVRKKLREYIRKYNTAKIQETIENNRSLKKTKQKLTCGKQKIKSLFDETREDQELTDQDMILKRIEEFYELYNSSVSGNLNLERESDEIPLRSKVWRVSKDTIEIAEFTYWEVQHALRSMKRGKAPGPDNILTDTIKEGEDFIAKVLAKLSTACITQGIVPEKWKEVNMIIFFKKGTSKTEDQSAFSQTYTSYSPEVYQIGWKIYLTATILENKQVLEAAPQPWITSTLSINSNHSVWPSSTMKRRLTQVRLNQ